MEKLDLEEKLTVMAALREYAREKGENICNPNTTQFDREYCVRREREAKAAFQKIAGFAMT